MYKYLLTLCLAVLLGGCSTFKPMEDPTQYFAFYPKAPPISVQDEDEILGIKRVRVPEYLRESRIAMRSNGSQIHYQEFQRYAEPADRNITRVMAQNLQSLLPNTLVDDAPFAKTTLERGILELEFIDFIAEVEARKVHLVVRYQLAEMIGQIVIDEPIPSGNICACSMEAMSRALARLAEELVERF